LNFSLRLATALTHLSASLLLFSITAASFPLPLTSDFHLIACNGIVACLRGINVSL
jgi:hypothetical protein